MRLTWRTRREKLAKSSSSTRAIPLDGRALLLYYPGMSLDVYLSVVQLVDVFEANITHNLNSMAAAADIYEALWRPEEIGISRAFQLIGPLRAGLDRLRSDPGKFREHNPNNGWGNYEGLVKFVSNYLEACRANPHARVRASR